MPFDTSYHVRGVVDYLANRSSVGVLLMNPIWFSIVLVAILVLILMLVWDGGPSFKLIFYMLVGVGCAVLAHDTLVEQRYIEKYETSAGEELVEGVQSYDGREGDETVAPREPEERPEYLVADQQSAFVRPTTMAELEAAVDS
jgi:hypothetical protein